MSREISTMRRTPDAAAQVIKDLTAAGNFIERVRKAFGARTRELTATIRYKIGPFGKWLKKAFGIDTARREEIRGDAVSKSVLADPNIDVARVKSVPTGSGKERFARIEENVIWFKGGDKPKLEAGEFREFARIEPPRQKQLLELQRPIESVFEQAASSPKSDINDNTLRASAKTAFEEERPQEQKPLLVPAADLAA